MSLHDVYRASEGKSDPKLSESLEIFNNGNHMLTSVEEILKIMLDMSQFENSVFSILFDCEVWWWTGDIVLKIYLSLKL